MRARYYLAALVVAMGAVVYAQSATECSVASSSSFWRSAIPRSPGVALSTGSTTTCDAAGGLSSFLSALWSLGDLPLSGAGAAYSYEASNPRRAAAYTVIANSEYLTVADTASTSITDASDFTACVLFRPDSWENNDAVVGKGASSTLNRGWYLRTLTSGGRFDFAVHSDADTSTVSAGAGGAGDATVDWHWGCGIYDATADEISGYIDTTVGTPVSTGTIGIRDDTGGFNIGSQHDAGTLFFGGRIQTTAIWKGANPSTAQLDAMYNGGRGPTCSIIEASYSPGLTVCCDLDEESGARTCSTGGLTLTDTNTVGFAEGVSPLSLEQIGDPVRAPYANRLPAAAFDDSNDEYLSVADPWSSGDIDFSVGCWVYLVNLTPDHAIASKDDGVAGREWRLFFDDADPDAWVFEIFDGAGLSLGAVSSAEVPVVQTWTLVVGAHDAANNEVGVSVNGAAYTTAATTGPAVDTVDPFELGRMTADAGTDLDGYLSQCFFIKEELSAADLAALYNNGVPIPSRMFSHVVATAPEALWDLDELSGTRTDFTVNAVNLTDNATVFHAAGLAPRAYGALALDGTNNVYLADASPSLPIGTTFSACGWIRPRDLTVLNTVWSYDSAADRGWVLYVDTEPKAIFSHARETDTLHSAVGTVGDPQSHEWALVCGSLDAAVPQVYVSVNGESWIAKVTAFTGTPDTSVNADLRVGHLQATGAEAVANIGPIYLWSSKLTANQLAILYNNGSAYSCSALPGALPDPRDCFDLDEPAGTTRVATFGDNALAETGTPPSAAGIADIPGGPTLRVADFEASASEYLTRADEAQFSPGDTNFSWWAWVTKESAGTHAIFTKASDLTVPASTEWVLASDNLDYYCRVSNGTTNRSSTTGPENRIQTPGVPTLIVCAHDATANVVKASQNGNAFVPTTTAGDAPQDTGLAIAIGAESGGTRPFDGTIGPVGWISGTALTDAQAALLWNSGDALNCNDVAVVVGITPTVCWNLDGASGTRSATIGSADLTDTNTVLFAGGLIRGGTGHAAAFHSASATYMTIGDLDALDGGERDWAYALWVRDDETAAVVDYFIAKADAATNIDHYLRRDDAATVIRFSVRDGATTEVGTAAANATTIGSAWHYVVAEYEAGEEVRLYVVDRDYLQADTTLTLPAGSNAQPFTLGARAQGDFNMTGALAQVIRLSRVTTAPERTCLYNGGLGRSAAEILAGACD